MAGRVGASGTRRVARPPFARRLRRHRGVEAGRPRRLVPAERKRREHTCRTRPAGARRRRPASGSLAFPASRGARVLRHRCRDAGRLGGPRVPPRPEQRRLRPLARRRAPTLAPPVPAPGRWAERPCGGERCRLRQHRHERLRALRTHGGRAMAEPADAAGEPGHDRAARRQRPRLHELDRSIPRRPGHALRPGHEDRSGALEVRHDRRSLALPARGLGRRCLASAVGGCEGARLLGNRQSVSLGRVARQAERRDVPGARPAHRLAPRPRRQNRRAALERPGHAPRRARLRLPTPAAADCGRGRRCGQGWPRDCLGPRDPCASLGDGGRRPPKRPRTVADNTGDGLSGTAWRRGDADGLGSRQSVRARCQPLLSRERPRKQRSGVLLGPITRRGTGELVALEASSGRRLWTRRFGSPNFGCATVAGGVVYTATYDGRIYGLSTEDGAIVARGRMRAGINACPAVAGSTLLIGAGADHPGFPAPVFELVAYRIPGR